MASISAIRAAVPASGASRAIFSSRKAASSRAIPRVATFASSKKVNAATTVADVVASASSDSEGLTVPQVHSLLAVLCDETEIAELDLEMGDFTLKVVRDVDAIAAPAPAPAPVAAAPAPVAAAPAPAAAAPAPAAMDDDEGLVSVTAPKVGILRRSRMVKGKPVGKGTLIVEGDSVKKGQVLCFVEQLGTQTPIEATSAGEVARFLVEDGGPVDYTQALVEIRPFFGGHIIGDSKHA